MASVPLAKNSFEAKRNIDRAGTQTGPTVGGGVSIAQRQFKQWQLYYTASGEAAFVVMKQGLLLFLLPVCNAGTWYTDLENGA